jgi:hypothetical protein
MPLPTPGSLVDNLQKRRDAITDVMNWTEQDTAKNPADLAAIRTRQDNEKKKNNTASPRWYMFGLDK